MNTPDLREALLSVMERKTHWAWPDFTSGRVPKDRLHVHFEQEYATYVRDFPIFLGRAYVECPVASVRAALAENIYEEETGKLSLGRPHAELFLRYPEGLGMDLGRFANVTLFHESARFRAGIDEATQEQGWEVALAVSTIFLEGNSFERAVLDASAPSRPEPPLAEHPLVVHYGLPVSALELTRAHRMVEQGHREAAWRMVLALPAECHAGVIAAMEEMLDRWLDYRDAVARACGLERPGAA
ncbi:MAG TPA: iron-containing redox enzyme family protein [Nannocystaceae bacterium]|nr:iron-containing redox enzyme family protein [Nannocystaceae bacterium]